MKNILLATTALVASAGIAAAEVTITGFAEIGVFDPGNDDGDELQFHTDIDATFTMTTETDGGLSFGASIDLDESDTDETLPVAVNNETGTPEDITTNGSPAFDNSLQGGEEIFVSGPFGTLTMGDTDGAYDFALQEAIIGSTIDDNNEHNGYNGNAGLDGAYDGQIARYEYTFRDFAIAVSGEIDDEGNSDPVLGIGATYSTAFGEFRGQPITVGLGIGYQAISDIEIDLDDDDDDDDDQDIDIYGVSADLDIAGVQLILNYSDGENSATGNDVEHFGIAVGYSFDALTVAANYGRFDYGSDANENDEIENDGDGIGFVVNYDLGGGAEAQFGYASNDGIDSDFEDASDDQYSLGLAIAF